MRFYTSILLLFLFLSVFSKRNNVLKSDYYDNQLYVKLLNDSKFILPEVEDASFDKLPIFNVDSFISMGVYEIKRPYKNLENEDLDNTYRIKFNGDISLLMKYISGFKMVDFVERVPIMYKNFTPNDNLYSNQWEFAKISAPLAWDISTGSSNVTVAIVDDAVRIDHEDLSASIWVNPLEVSNGIDDDGNGYIDDINGYDVADLDNDPRPPFNADANFFSHGTHCSGIAGGTTNNNLGIASIGNGISIIPVKSTHDNTTGPYIDEGYSGIAYAIAAGADVISMSWGGGGFSSTEQSLINQANVNGIILVAAAGNDDASTIQYPAGYNNVIAVAASQPNDQRASFSNYGSWVDITAPGVNILSTTAGSTSEYTYYDGTSMACPMVAGLLGLMKSNSPGASTSQIISCLLNSADNIDAQNPSYVGMLGAGRINAVSALGCLNPNTPPIANFDNVYQTCDGIVQFNDNSYPTPDTWSWDFGDGTISTLQNPNKTYSTPGLYTVSLTACNAFGCDTITKTNSVNFSPNSNFCNETILPTSGNVTLSDCSGVIYDNGGASGNYANYSNVEVFITPNVSPGSQIELTFNSFNLESGYDYLRIYDGPTIGSPLIGSYSGGSLPNGGSITSTSNALTLDFSTDGSVTYSGFEILYEILGGTGMVTANFNMPDTVAFNANVNFQNTSTNYNNSFWDFGDGNVSTDDNPTHNYTALGQYNVQLISSNCSNSDTIIKSIYVTPPPVLSYYPDSLNYSLLCGAQLNDQITILNTGQGNLHIENDSTLQNANQTLEVLSLTYGVDLSSEYPNTISSLNSFFTNYNLTETNTQSASVLSNYLIGKDVLLIAEQENASSTVQTSLSASVLNYVNNGGTVVYCTDKGIDNYGLLNYNFATNASDPLNVVKPSHPLTQNVASQFNKLNATYCINTSDVDYVSVIDGAESGVGYKNIGSGKLIYIAFDYYESSIDASRIIANAFEWVNAEKGSGWLVEQNLDTLVLYGDTTYLNFTIDASALLSGQYNATLNFTTNDPTNPSVDIPVVLDVYGDAVFTSLDSCVTFNNQYVGLSDSASVNVYNSGCDTLTINSIYTGHSDFSVNSTIYNIAPNDTLALAVYTNPSSVGFISSYVYFNTNIGLDSVCVSSDVLPSPQIGHSPDTVDVFLSCGDSSINYFDVYNWGLGDLEFQTNPVSAGGTGPLKVLAYIDGADLSSEYPKTIDAIDSYFTNYVLNTTTATSASVMASELSNIDVLLVPELESINPTGIANIVPAVQSFVNNGGTVVKTHSTGLDELGLISFSSATSFSNGQFNILNGSHPLMQNIVPPFEAENQCHALAITDPAYVSLANYGSYSAVGYKNIGLGRVIYLPYDYYNTNPSASRVIANALEWAQSTRTLWLSVPLQADTILNNDTTQVEFSVNAEGLLAGTYYSIISISSNDPATPQVDVPVRLSVTGSPELEAQSACVDFGNLYENQDSTLSFTLYNLGCENLTVTDIVPDLSYVVPSAISATIPPYDSLTLDLTFQGTSFGVYSGNVIISSDGGADTLCYEANILASPVLNYYPDSLFLQVDCEEIDSIPFTIYNTGNGSLDWDLGFVSAVNYFDDFESGFNSDLWSSYSGLLNGSCGVASGGSALNFDNRSSRNAITNSFNATNGGTIDFYLKINTGSGSCDGAESGEGVNLEYSTNNGTTWNLIRYYAPGSYNSFTNVTEVIPHAAEQPNVQFRWVQASFTGSAYDTWLLDDISIDIQGATTGLISSGTTNPGDSTMVHIPIDGSDFSLGLNNTIIELTSNDPTNPSVDIPVVVDVYGDAVFTSLDSCVTFNNQYVGLSDSASVNVYNSGCDTLTINSMYAGHSDFSVNSTIYNIAPNDTLALAVYMNPSSVGFISSYVYFNTNIGLDSVCVSSDILPSPVLNYYPDSLFLQIDCDELDSIPFTIYNIGYANLDWDLSFLSAVSYSDDFESGFNSGLWSSYSGSLNNSCGTVSGSSALNFYGVSSRNAITNSFNTTNGGTIDFYLKINYSSSGTCDGAESGEGVYLEYSTNNGATWSAIDYYAPGSFNNFTNVTEVIPTAAQQSNVQFRWVQASNSGSTYDVWLLDDVSVNIQGASTGLISSGTTNPGDSTLIYIPIDASDFNLGLNNTFVELTSNDPSQPDTLIPLTVLVDGFSELEFVSSPCINFGSIVLGQNSNANAVFSNIGCAVGNIISVSASGPFTATNYPNNIAVNQTEDVELSYVPTSLGVSNGTLTIVGSDNTIQICLTGTATQPPVASVSPSNILSNLQSCDNIYDTIAITIENIGSGTLNYSSSFNANATWLSSSNNSGSVAAGQSETIYVYFDNSNQFSGGVYQNQLNITTNDPANPTINIPVTMQISADPCVSIISSANTCSGNVNFTASYINPVTSVFWDFGDGNQSTITSPSHTYASEGNYTVSVVACNATSCDTAYQNINYFSSTFCDTITLPTSGAITNNNCHGVLVDDGGAYGPYSNNVNSTITIAPTGVDYVTLEVLFQELESGYDYIRVYDGYNISAPLITQLTGFNPTSNSIVSTGPAITIQFSSDLSVIFDGFLMNWSCGYYTTVPPTADFSYAMIDPCKASIKFQDLSSNNPTNWYWDFDNGQSSTLKNPIADFTSSGIYDVTLISSNSAGSDTFNIPVEVELIKADFTMKDTSVVNDVVYLINTSSSPTAFTNWLWEFSDGSISNAANPNHTFTSLGIDTVNLTVYDSNGCIDSIQKNIFIKDSITTGIHEINDFSISVYPNPTSDIVHVSFDRLKNNLQYSIYDINGKLLSEESISNNNRTQEINFKGYNSGTYFINILSGNNFLESFKVIKIR